MTETTPEAEAPAKALDAPPTTGYALYDTAELRFLPGVYSSAKDARAAHKESLVEGRKYEARQV